MPICQDTWRNHYHGVMAWGHVTHATTTIIVSWPEPKTLACHYPCHDTCHHRAMMCATTPAMVPRPVLRHNPCHVLWPVARHTYTMSWHDPFKPRLVMHATPPMPWCHDLANRRCVNALAMARARKRATTLLRHVMHVIALIMARDRKHAMTLPRHVTYATAVPHDACHGPC